MMQYPSFKVFVRCFTYNHSAYIGDALNGFTDQETAFPYLCCIVDDASTDGAQGVIREYLEQNFDLPEYTEDTEYAFITYVRHKTNKNCYFVVLQLKYNHHSRNKAKSPYLDEWRKLCEYEALCEGDDYWCHKGKLQMQADYLDRNEDCFLCCTAGTVLSDSVSTIEVADYECDIDIPPCEVIGKGGLWILTCTSMYRPVIFDYYVKLDFAYYCHVGDYCLQILSVIFGRAHFLAAKTGVYRFQSGGSWTRNAVSSSYLKLIDGWKSEVDMLKGMDKFSEGRFHKCFEERIGYYLYCRISEHRKEKGIVRKMKTLFRRDWKCIPFMYRARISVFDLFGSLGS